MTAQKIFLLAFLFAHALFAFGDDPSNLANAPVNPLQVKAEWDAGAKLVPGSSKKLRLALTLQPDFFAYEEAFVLEVTEPTQLKIVDLKVSPVVDFLDAVSKKNKKGIKDRGLIEALVFVPEGIGEGPLTVEYRLRYQACTLKYCLFPKVVTGTIKASIETPHTPKKSQAAKASLSQFLQLKTAEDFEAALKDHFFLALLALFIFGFLTSLTPCVYPMLPVTIAVIGGSADQPLNKRLLLAVSYVLGISIVYSALGVAAAATGSLFGSLLGHPIAVATIALNFAFLALSMLGLFEINFLGVSTNAHVKGGSFKANLLMGMIAGTMASPCVGPILFGVLALISKTQDLGLGALLLFIYSWGFGALFIALGVSSKLLKRLPRSGNWLNTIQLVMGSLLMLTAFMVARPLVSSELFYGGIALYLAILLGLFAYGRTPRFRRAPARGFTIVLLFGLLTLTTFLGIQAHRAEVEAQLPSSEASVWKPYKKETVEATREQRRPLLIDFYADWCFACIEMEKKVFSLERVRKEMKHFELLKIDATLTTDETDLLLEEYNVQSLPTYIFVGPDGERLDSLTLREFEEPDEFIERLKKARATFEAQP